MVLALNRKYSLFGYRSGSIKGPVSLFILKEKQCQTIPPGTLNTFYILVIHTDNAQVSFVLIEVCQPGSAVINFSKIAFLKVKVLSDFDIRQFWRT